MSGRWCGLAMAVMLLAAGCHRPSPPPPPKKSSPATKLGGSFLWGRSQRSPTGQSGAGDASDVPWLPGDPSVRMALERFGNGSDADRLAIAGLLIRMGTEESITGLVLVLRDLPAGEVKSLICQKLESLQTAGREELLLGLLLVDADQEVGRALTSALASQADEALIGRLAELHDIIPETPIRERLQEVLSQGTGDRVTTALGKLVMEGNRRANDPLVLAAGRALADNASAQALDALFGKLSSVSKQSESSALAELVAGIWRPRAHQPLLYAAEGNKVATSTSSRIAAIRALRNFPGDETIEVLSRLSSDPDPSIKAAADQTARSFE